MNIAIKCILSLLFIFPTITHAAGDLLRLDQYPTQQGWSFNFSSNLLPGLVESNISSPSSSSLIMDTNGIGHYGEAYYSKPSDLSPDLPYSIILTARAVSIEDTSSNPWRDFFQVEAIVSKNGALTSFAGCSLYAAYVSCFGQPVAVDTSIRHQYRLFVDPKLDRQDLYIDGTLRQSLAGVVHGASGMPSSTILFGDGSWDANGRIEITHLEFQQAIPEPSTVVLTFVGIFVVAAKVRKRSRTDA